MAVVYKIWLMLFQKMNTIFLLTSCIIAGLILPACSSDEPGMSRTALLTTLPWKFSNAENLDPVTTATLEAVLQGTTYTYKADGTYLALLYGFNTSGSWVFNMDKSQITLDPGSNTEEVLTITSLTSEELLYTTLDSGITVTLRYIH